jgi:hypothetical protein
LDATRPAYGAELAAYRRAKTLRAEAVSRNRSRAMRGLPPLPLPALPDDPPARYHIINAEGYLGAVLAKSNAEALERYAEDCEEAGADPEPGARAVRRKGG